jgi:phosphoenolpyruvate-protein kinase (PTS system EI component)
MTFTAVLMSVCGKTTRDRGMAMDKELAKHVVAVGFHSLSLLQSLIPILKEHCSQDEYSQCVKGIAAVSAEMSAQLFNQIFAQYPELEKEVERKINKYGQFV